MGTILNPELLQLAATQTSRTKESFVDAATATGAAPPPGGDPAAGGDPMAGPMPPMPAMGAEAAPAAAAGGGGMGPEEVKMLIQEVLMQQGGGMGGGGMGGGMGGEGEKPKMKVDVNQEIYQIKKLLVMMAQEMGMPVPATLLLGDPAQDPHVPDSEAAKDPLSAAAQQQSAISPIQPMQGASPDIAQQAGQKAASVQDMAIHRGQAIAPPPRSSVQRNTDTARALLSQLNG